MKNEENLLSWLLTEKDPSADFIEDMEGDALQRVIKDSDAIAVYFCELHLLQSCVFHPTSSRPQFQSIFNTFFHNFRLYLTILLLKTKVSIFLSVFSFQFSCQLVDIFWQFSPGNLLLESS